MEVLKYAISSYEKLVSEFNESSFGKNSEDKKKGIEIYQRYEELGIKRVGRGLGLNGEYFNEDVNSGRWKHTEYEVACDDKLPNRNWFHVEDFIKKIDQQCC